MLDAINIAATGLTGFETALRDISNDTVNLNTPGFKSSNILFSDAMYSTPGAHGGASGQLGSGVNIPITSLNFTQGTETQTGNSLDLAINGQGLFTLQDASGKITYSRAGQFEFNSSGILVVTATEQKVMGVDSTGKLIPISIANLKTNAASATANISFTGNLTGTSQTISNITVIDAAGGTHTLTLNMTQSGTSTGTWQAQLMDGTTTVGTGQLVFGSSGAPTPSTLSMTYTPSGGAAQNLTLNFSGATSSSGTGLAAMAVSNSDGTTASAIQSTTFNANGNLVITYQNGQTSNGASLALARFDSTDAVATSGNNQFVSTNNAAWHSGTAGTGQFGTIQAGYIEGSNVDLSQEFSNLVIMQRGYQASSEIVTTANDMLQTLFAMKPN
ncbi:MAG: flagellar hook-basal body complex protein [Curvibacter sp.]|nr:flagellar hook-basal body complex protein [Curvibacter sp.]